MKTIRFYKEFDEWYGDRWYADLPEWKGEKADLEMVCGANKMLDILAQGETEVIKIFSDKPFEQYSTVLQLLREGDEEGGGYYFFSTYQNIDFQFEIWLCDVTKFVFGDLPKVIYLS